MWADIRKNRTRGDNFSNLIAIKIPFNSKLCLIHCFDLCFFCACEHRLFAPYNNLNKVHRSDFSFRSCKQFEICYKIIFVRSLFDRDQRSELSKNQQKKFWNKKKKRIGRNACFGNKLFSFSWLCAVLICVRFDCVFLEYRTRKKSVVKRKKKKRSTKTFQRMENQIHTDIHR